MEFGQRRRRLRGDLEREGDEFEGAYGRTLAQQSAWGRTRLAFRRVRREAPVVWEILIVVIIVALALGADIYYISNNHKEEMKSIEETYKKQMKNLEAKFKAEIDTLSLKTSITKDKFLDEHATHTKDMRKKQKDYLENVVKSLNDNLKDLIDKSDTHWDDHDSFHEENVEKHLDDNDNPQNNNKPDNSQRHHPNMNSIKSENNRHKRDKNSYDDSNTNNDDDNISGTLDTLLKNNQKGGGIDLTNIKDTKELAKALGIGNLQ